MLCYNARMPTIYLALASNLGDREKNLRDALMRVAEFIQIARVSSIYESEARSTRALTRTLTLVCAGITALSPIDVIRHTRGIEKEMGRVDGLRSPPRPIDVDILLYDRVIELSPALTLPHPRLHTRADLLVPLAEIAPALVHPRQRVTMRALLAQLKDAEQVYLYRASPIQSSVARLRSGGFDERHL
jgi:2-amino-4-hydroxy-6-hydroxymethyldihydropteridine diphosphokinase